MAKYLIDSTDIEIEEVSGTENLKFNLASGNSVEQMIGDLSNLSTTSKSNIVNAINEVNQNQINSNTYSTTETIVGKWIDNKPIYRKVIDFGYLTNNSLKSVSLNISNLDKIVYYTGIANEDNSEVCFTLPSCRGANTQLEIAMYINNDGVNIETYSDRSSFYAYVIVEYTKTTD